MVYELLKEKYFKSNQNTNVFNILHIFYMYNDIYSSKKWAPVNQR